MLEILVLVQPREDNDFTTESRRFLVAFFALQLTGLFTLTIVLLTVALSPNVAKRHICWLNFIFTWMVSGLSYSLLVGRPIDWEPPYGLCLSQAVLIYTVPTLTACTTTALMIHVFLSIRSILEISHIRTPLRWTIVLSVLPYPLSIGIATLPLAYGITNHDLVVRRGPSHFYCGIENGIPGRVSSIVVTSIMLLCLGVEIAIGVTLSKNWKKLKKRKQNHPMLSLAFRVGAFSILGCLAIGLGFVFMFIENHGPAINIILATLPVFAASIFGTQKDILDVWVSLLRGRRPPKVDFSASHSVDGTPVASADSSPQTGIEMSNGSYPSPSIVSYHNVHHPYAAQQ